MWRLRVDDANTGGMVRAMAARTKKRPAARPEGTSALNINLPTELMEKLDAWVEKLNEGDGARWTRTDVIRTSLNRAVTERGAKGDAP